MNKENLNVDCVGHTGLIYLRTPSFSGVFIIQLPIAFLFLGILNLSPKTHLEWNVYTIGTALFFTFLTYIILQKLQRKDLYVITDKKRYFVFILHAISEPLKDDIITDIYNDIFHSETPISNNNYNLLDLQAGRMPFHKLFWINGKKVTMEPWQGSKGLGNKFQSTDSQQKILESINRLYVGEKKFDALSRDILIHSDYDLDELFVDSARLVVSRQAVSPALLQRNFGIDYSEACRIIEQLEEATIVGAYVEGVGRSILINNEEKLIDKLAELTWT